MKNEPTNIVTVQMEKDQSFTVTLNGKELLDVVAVHGHEGFAPNGEVSIPEVQCDPSAHYATFTMRVAQYNVLQPKVSVEEEERLRRGQLIAAHHDGECIVCRPKDGGRWTQADPTRDGWQWSELEYARLQ